VEKRGDEGRVYLLVRVASSCRSLFVCVVCFSIFETILLSVLIDIKESWRFHYQRESRRCSWPHNLCERERGLGHTNRFLDIEVAIISPIDCILRDCWLDRDHRSACKGWRKS
jgi:hypothetical protein